MEHGPIESIVGNWARSQRLTAIVIVILTLVGGIGMFYFHLVTPFEVNSIVDLVEMYDKGFQRGTINNAVLLNTDYYYEETKERDGRVTSTSYGLFYLYLPEEEDEQVFVIVRYFNTKSEMDAAQDIYENITVEGKMAKPDDVDTEIIGSIKDEWGLEDWEVAEGLFTETEDLVAFQVLFGIVVIVFLYSLVALISYVSKAASPKKMKFLRDYANSTNQDIDSVMQSAGGRPIFDHKSLLITDRYIVGTDEKKWFMQNTADLVWVYQEKVRKYNLGVPWGKKLGVALCFKDGIMRKAAVSPDMVGDLYAVLDEHLPGVIKASDDTLKKLYRKNFTEFMRVYSERYEAAMREQAEANEAEREDSEDPSFSEREFSSSYDSLSGHISYYSGRKVMDQEEEADDDDDDDDEDEVEDSEDEDDDE